MATATLEAGQGVLFQTIQDVDEQAKRVLEAKAKVDDLKGELGTVTEALHATPEWEEVQEADEALKAAKTVLAELRRDLTKGCMARVEDASQE